MFIIVFAVNRKPVMDRKCFFIIFHIIRNHIQRFFCGCIDHLQCFFRSRCTHIILWHNAGNISSICICGICRIYKKQFCIAKQCPEIICINRIAAHFKTRHIDQFCMKPQLFCNSFLKCFSIDFCCSGSIYPLCSICFSKWPVVFRVIPFFLCQFYLFCQLFCRYCLCLSAHQQKYCSKSHA